MNCPDSEKLARVALGSEDDSPTIEHIETCALCGARLAEMRSLVGGIEAAYQRLSDGHERTRDELMRRIADIDAPHVPEPNEHSRRFFGGLSMRERLTIGGFGAAAMVAILFLWIGDAARPTSALAQVANNIRQATSYKVTMEMEMTQSRPGSEVKSKATGMQYWRAPDAFRRETEMPGDGPGRKSTEILSTQKPGLVLDNWSKSYRRIPARRGHVPQLAVVEQLASFTGQADRELGTREIDGSMAKGYKIDGRKIDEDAPAGTSVELWVDVLTNLPSRIEYEFTQASMAGVMIFRDFKWNVALDAKLFDATPPEGYKEATPPERSLEEQVDLVTAALSTYAELCGGKYPQVTYTFGEVTRDEMYEAMGIKDGRPDREQLQSAQFGKVSKAQLGFALLSGDIMWNIPDAAYYGRTVGPKDKEKVLVRWQLDDGKYQVIFGDLRAEVVARERLKELER